MLLDSNIKFEKFVDHEWIELINQSLNEAVEGKTSIPQYCLDLRGMSGMKYRAFINNLMRKIPNPRYLEIGTYTGSTLCAAVGDVPNIQALAVDNFSYDNYCSLTVCQNNVDQVKDLTANIKVMEQNFDDFDFSAHGKFNVYMYDADHREQDQKNAIIKCSPALEEYAIIIVDDWNYAPEKNGTSAGFRESQLEILAKWEIDTGDHVPYPSDWHCGYGIFLVKNKKD